MSAVEVLAGVDIVALRLSEEGALQVLLLRRQREPYAGQWALPGVLINGRCADVSLDAAAARALEDKARLQPHYLEQVATVGNGVRDPRGWSLSTCYLALLAPDAEPQDDNLRFVELSGLTAGAQALPFDHTQLVRLAVERLRGKSVYSSLPLYLLAPRFTVTEALTAFQACLGEPVQHTTLRGRLERMKAQGWISDTGQKNYPKMGRPQNLLEHGPHTGEAFIFDRSLLAQQAFAELQAKKQAPEAPGEHFNRCIVSEPACVEKFHLMMEKSHHFSAGKRKGARGALNDDLWSKSIIQSEALAPRFSATRRTVATSPASAAVAGCRRPCPDSPP